MGSYYSFYTMDLKVHSVSQRKADSRIVQCPASTFQAGPKCLACATHFHSSSLLGVQPFSPLGLWASGNQFAVQYSRHQNVFEPGWPFQTNESWAAFEPGCLFSTAAWSEKAQESTKQHHWPRTHFGASMIWSAIRCTAFLDQPRSTDSAAPIVVQRLLEPEPVHAIAPWTHGRRAYYWWITTISWYFAATSFALYLIYLFIIS